jgi:hypothetical protein
MLLPFTDGCDFAIGTCDLDTRPCSPLSTGLSLICISNCQEMKKSLSKKKATFLEFSHNGPIQSLNDHDNRIAWLIQSKSQAPKYSICTVVHISVEKLMF